MNNNRPMIQRLVEAGASLNMNLRITEVHGTTTRVQRFNNAEVSVLSSNIDNPYSIYTFVRNLILPRLNAIVPASVVAVVPPGSSSASEASEKGGDDSGDESLSGTQD